MDFAAKWISASKDIGDICPIFRKQCAITKELEKADLYLTALGTYAPYINGKRIGKQVLAPGWTAYDKRLQYQIYDVTEMMERANTIEILLGKGWYASPMPGWYDSEDKLRRMSRRQGIVGELRLHFSDGTMERIATDGTWQWGESAVRFSEIYDGEIYDAGFETDRWEKVQEFDGPTQTLIEQEGEDIREMERVAAKSVFVTPAGETIVDFGQEVTGYIEFTVEAKQGDEIHIRHGEVLDKYGNFYRDNYRSAKAEIRYICKEGLQTWHPTLTFFGFRYLKIMSFPGEVKPEQFTAIVVFSNIRQTGFLKCGLLKLNQLFSNILWSQKGNFLDVPTDCPQRDERLGWTGDAQVFVKTASYNFDVERFFTKWLHDLKADQHEDGSVGQVIPDYMPEGFSSAAWGDASVICPWQIYLTYGNPKILEDQFESMKRWVDYITANTSTPYLWTGGTHFGDWLGLDAPSGNYKGSSREDFIASAFYAYSTELFVKSGRVLGKDMLEYEHLYRQIVAAFRQTYPVYYTQTEHVLAVQFKLAENLQETADALAAMVVGDGCQMRTGFVGTPYILHVLSDYGHADIAYSLLLREQYPSWLYSVNKGATTIWEHWDGIMENGDFWSDDMNSYNHYAYGSVADWVYEKAAGIRAIEKTPGFERVVIAPTPDIRLGWLQAEMNTRHGKISSKWVYTEEGVRYEIRVDMPAAIVINDKEMKVEPGRYIFWDKP